MDNMVNCKICQQEFKEDKNLHAHIKAHNMFVAQYYQSQFPKYDKYDNSIIRFKNKEQYLSADFNSRTNLKLWFKNASIEEARSYCKWLLQTRKSKKNLIWTPTQVELRSAMIPPIQEFNRLFGDYYKLCQSLGFKNKLSSYSLPPKEEVHYDIYVDTREQDPLVFNHAEIQIATLPFGDYYSTLENNIFIERKSLNDLIGTLSRGFERFQKEILRTREQNCYLVVLVEEEFNNVMSFNLLSLKFKKGARIQPEFIFHNIRDLIQKYENIQFLFVKGREESARVVKCIFNSGDSIKNADLQFLYDTGEL